MKKSQILIATILISTLICLLSSMPTTSAAGAINLNKNTGYVGDTITVSGDGFGTFSVVTITFGGVAQSTTPISIISVGGQFTATFTVPNVSPGNYSVSANDGLGNVGEATFRVMTPPSVVVSPGSWTMDVGQSKAFLATASGGSGSYPASGYHWYVGGVVQGGQTGSSFSFSPGSVGSFSITATVTDSLGATSAQSSSVSVTVASALVAPSVSASLGTVTQGQNSVLSSSAVSTGTAPYAYQWLQRAPGAGSYSLISGATSSSYSFVTSDSTTTGTWSFELQVTDAVLAVVTSNPVSVTVNSVPTVTVSPGSWTMDVGQSKAFLATASGGSGSYPASGYHWYVGGVVQGGQTGSSFSFSPGSVGSFSITATVTDSLGATSAQSSSVSVTVASALVAPSVSVSLGTVTQGQNSVLSSSAVSTGTAPYAYQWLQRAPGAGSYSLISGATSSSYSFVTSDSTTTGTWSFELQVTDAVLAVVTSNPVSVTVNSVPTVTVSPGSWTMDVGQSKAFLATASGGSGSYPASGYHWYVGGVVQGGQTGSSFSFSPGSVGSFSITATVTDSLGATSAQSSSVSVTANASPSVVVSPVGPFTLDVGQVKVFTATASGGSGVIHYQWYVDGSAVGSDSVSYSYSAAVGSHLVTCKVTDSASAPVTSSASNAVSVTVNSALVAPTVSASLGTITQGQTSSLTSTTVSTGTSPYTYQWLQRAPGGSYTAVGSNSPSFSFVTTGALPTGSWSFILQVTDTVGASVNSSAISVTVNIAPLDHFIFSSVGVQTAGTQLTITITAKNSFNNTLTNYSGTNTLSVSTGTISPATTGAFSNGVWTGAVMVTGAGSGIWLITSGGGMSGTSDTFSVNPGVLDHLYFSPVNDQVAGSPFNITVVAKDFYNNTVTSYNGAPSLTCSAGLINPSVMDPFVNGIGSQTATVASAGSSVTITATDGSRSVTSNVFKVAIAATPTPTPAPTLTPHPISTSTPSSTSKPSTTASPTPSQTPSPSETTVTIIATASDGSNFTLTAQGAITNSTIQSAKISLDGSNTTTISIVVVAQSETNGLGNLTIPNSAIPYAGTPSIYVNNVLASNQGYVQDAKNYYVWYATNSGTYELKIVFKASSSGIEFPFWVLLTVIPAAIVLVIAIVLARKRISKPLAIKEDDYSDYF